MAEIKYYWKFVNHWAFWVTLLLSAFLIVTAFFVPPKAVIDASVLTATGELLGFATLGTVIEGIEKGRKVTFQKGDANMTIGRHGEPEHNNEDNNEETI